MSDELNERNIIIDGKQVAKVLLPADHPARSAHHEGGYRSEDDWLRAEHGMVVEPGNPDNYGAYPGQDEFPDVD